ncbi:hypothetical protein CHUAL_003486 [Chamberlinius hualienensis]
MSELVKTLCDKSLAVVIREFSRVIAPIYGDQTCALSKIAEGQDRECQILCSKSEQDGAIEPVGIIVYKRRPTNEYQKFGIEKSLEIKSLFVINEKVNSGKGYGNLLIKRIEDEAISCDANGMHVTVSETVPQSIKFFKKHGFIEMHHWHGKYKDGVIEYLLFKKLVNPYYD